MSLNSMEQKKIRTRIARYERNFKKPPHPCFDDGGGTRFLIGPMYLLVNDVDGALKHYKWFSRKFADSSDDPIHTLCWALALSRAGKEKDAIYRLRRAHLSNTYMIPKILNIPHGQPSIQRFGSWENPTWLEETGPEYFGMWTDQDRVWLGQSWSTPSFQAMVLRHIELTQQLAEVSNREKRHEIIKLLGSLAHK